MLCEYNSRATWFCRWRRYRRTVSLGSKTFGQDKFSKHLFSSLFPKSPPPPNYTQEDLELAINAVNKESLSLREAERIYNFPKDSIRRKSNKSISVWLICDMWMNLLIFKMFIHLWDTPIILDQICLIAKPFSWIVSELQFWLE